MSLASPDFDKELEALAEVSIGFAPNKFCIDDVGADGVLLKKLPVLCAGWFPPNSELVAGEAEVAAELKPPKRPFVAGGAEDGAEFKPPNILLVEELPREVVLVAGACVDPIFEAPKISLVAGVTDWVFPEKLNGAAAGVADEVGWELCCPNPPNMLFAGLS